MGDNNLVWAHDGDDELDADLSVIEDWPSDEPVEFANGTSAPEVTAVIVVQSLFGLSEEWVGEAGWPALEAVANLAHNGTPITDATLIHLLVDYTLVDQTGALLSDDHGIVIRASTEIQTDGSLWLFTPY